MNIFNHIYIFLFMFYILLHDPCQAYDYHDDEILFLPGLPWQPPFKQYSGYLSASETRRLHYWLVESERDPENDPVVVWFNGGPGCSSLNGFFTENGPFWALALDGQTLVYNEYAWNKISNVLFLESPAGVGYAYATDGQYETTDDQTADDNFRAIQDFFIKFPHFKRNDLIITGESYAGVYIPTLLERFLNHTEFNLKGAMIGNGMITGYLHTFSTDMFYWHSHALISDRLFQDLQDACCGELGTEEDCQFLPPKSFLCGSLVIQTVQDVYGLNINRYSIYSPCIMPTVTMATSKRWAAHSIELMLKQLQGANITSSAEKLARLALKPPQAHAAFVACVGGDGTTNYLRREDVRKAINMLPNEVTGLPKWESCSSHVDDSTGVYKSTYPDMLGVLSRVVSHPKKYKILMYYGDTDFICSFVTGRYAFHQVADRVGLKNYSPHQPWYYESLNDDESRQIGGYWERYDNLMYLTFRGSGHMVPTDLPYQSLDILDRYINGDLMG